MIEPTSWHSELLRGILNGKVGKKGGRTKVEDFPQIMKDMGCGTFREVKMFE